MAGNFPEPAQQKDPEFRNSLEAIAGIPDPFMRLEALESYLRRSRRQGNSPPVDKHLYLHLTDTAYRTRNFTRVLRYGERALQENWNNPRIKMALYFYLSRACEEESVNLGKALQYAAFIHELATVVDPGHTDSAIWVRFVAPTQRLSMRILAAEARNGEDWGRALRAGVSAFEMDPSEDSARELYETARHAESNPDGGEFALEALEVLCRSSLVRPEYLNRLAFWYSRRDRNDRAVVLLKESYNIQFDPAVAYTIGKLLQKSNPDEAMDYLAEAVQSGKEDLSTRARRLLEHLVFNVQSHGIPAQELEKKYDTLLQAAAERVNVRKSGDSH